MMVRRKVLQMDQSVVIPFTHGTVMLSVAFQADGRSEEDVSFTLDNALQQGVIATVSKVVPALNHACQGTSLETGLLPLRFTVNGSTQIDGATGTVTVTVSVDNPDADKDLLKGFVKGGIVNDTLQVMVESATRSYSGSTPDLGSIIGRLFGGNHADHGHDIFTVR